MRGICLDKVNSAGGVLKSTQQDFVSAEGNNLIVVGDRVLPHLPPPIHSVPHTMANGVPWITIEGKPVCFKDNSATCGHKANGTNWIYIDD